MASLPTRSLDNLTLIAVAIKDDKVDYNNSSGNPNKKLSNIQAKHQFNL